MELFTAAADPFDADFGPVFFGLYGVGADGLSEHIADRATLAGVVALAGKLVPGIKFQEARSQAAEIGAESNFGVR